MSSVFTIAISGLNAAMTRVANAATNIANISSTGKMPRIDGENAGSFAPRDIVNLSNEVGGVSTQSVTRTPSYRPMVDPSAPDANKQGLVAAPNIALESELTDLLMAEIAYKANAKAIAAEKKNEETLLNTIA